MKKHLISMAATVILLTACGGAKKQTLLRQIILNIQWNNLQTYRYYAIAYPDLRI